MSSTTTSAGPRGRATRSTVRRTVRASAVYDLVVTAGFALPFTAPAVFAALTRVHEASGWSGLVPTPDPFTIFFANLTGSVVVVWSLFRLLRPTVAAGFADVAARGLFTLAMVALLLAGASPVVVPLLVLELGWGVVQAVVLLRR